MYEFIGIQEMVISAIRIDQSEIPKWSLFFSFWFLIPNSNLKEKIFGSLLSLESLE